MEFNGATTAGLFVAVIALGVAGLVFAPIPMATQTILTMVLPSMIGFGLVTFAIGLKYGRYRAVN